MPWQLKEYRRHRENSLGNPASIYNFQSLLVSGFLMTIYCSWWMFHVPKGFFCPVFYLPKRPLHIAKDAVSIVVWMGHLSWTMFLFCVIDINKSPKIILHLKEIVTPLLLFRPIKWGLIVDICLVAYLFLFTATDHGRYFKSFLVCL